MEYMIACYNSREGWIPRLRSIQSSETSELVALDKAKLFCGNRLSFNSGFKFTDRSLDSLFQTFSSMAIQEYDSQNILAVDYSFHGIQPRKIIQMVVIASGKIRLQFTDEFLKQFEELIRRDE